MSASVKDRVIETVSKELGLPKEKIELNSDFKDDLGADSLDLVELFLAVETEFDITIADSEAEKLVTVEKVVAYVEKTAPTA